MIITTRSPGRNGTARSAFPSRRQRTGGFSLTEVIIASSLGAIVMAGVLSTVLFLGRSGANIGNYSDMESQARRALELFAQDTRQARAVQWNSATSISLLVNLESITYAYDAANQTFTRSVNSATPTVLIEGVSSDFQFQGYEIDKDLITADLSTSAGRAAADASTKQLQIYLTATRQSITAAQATNTVLSARFILRNKKVTA